MLNGCRSQLDACIFVGPAAAGSRYSPSLRQQREGAHDEREERMGNRIDLEGCTAVVTGGAQGFG
ncbi:MAG TPA: hypothetical protein VN524_18735, partial [Hyphomicrobiaceae bacterium]|nr:hypothetical protein [Hyphomicrobiaceae bacterium]